MPRPLPIRPNANKKIWRETDLERLVRIQKGRCYYCGDMMMESHGAGSLRDPTIDHKQPRSSKGKDDPSNYAAACLGCNQEKGSLDENEYRLLKAMRIFMPWSRQEFSDRVLGSYKVVDVRDDFFAPFRFAKKDLVRDRKKGEPRLIKRRKRRIMISWAALFRSLFFSKKGGRNRPAFSRKKTDGKASSG